MKSNKMRIKNHKSSLNEVTRFIKSIPLPALVLSCMLLSGLMFVSYSLISNNSKASTTKLVSPGVWQSFESQADRFRADFPATPTEHSASFTFDGDTIPIRLYVYSDQNEKISYIITASEISNVYADESDTQVNAMLKSAIRGVSVSSNADIVSESDLIDFRGYKAMRATYGLKTEAQSIHIYTIIFYSGQRVYQIVVGGETEEVFNTFVDSFELY